MIRTRLRFGLPLCFSRSTGFIGCAALIVSTIFMGCSGASADTRALPGDDSSSSAPITWPKTQASHSQAREALAAPCVEGAMRSCVFYLPVHNGVRPCIQGEQRCEQGEWSGCLESASSGADAAAHELAVPDAGL